MTNATRRDLAAAVRSARRRVTRVAVVMRGEVCGNRESGTPIHRRVVTTGATVRRARRAGVVLCVIEVHVERLVEARRKIFQRRVVALRVGVADQAHRNRRRRELAAMAIGAGFVPGEARRGGVISAFVTRRAGEGTMLGAAVEKSGVVRVRSLGRDGHG